MQGHQSRVYYNSSRTYSEKLNGEEVGGTD